MKTILKLIFSIFFLAMIAGCSFSTVYTKITPFYSEELKSYKTYKIIPSNGQENSLAFKEYTRLIESKLSKAGLKYAEDAELVMQINFGIDNGKTITTTAPVYGQKGGDMTTTHGSYNNQEFSKTTYTVPTYGIVGTTPYKTTEYTKYMTVDIFDAKTNKKIYEARATNQDETSEIIEMVPYLINAIFDDFPGKNGKTIEIKQKQE